MIIEGMDTSEGRSREAAYRARNRFLPCKQCDCLVKVFCLCSCGIFMIAELKEPMQVTLPTWS